MRDLPRFVAAAPVGKAVRVVLLRHGVRKTVTITLGRLEDGEVLMARQRSEPAAPSADTEFTPPDPSASAAKNLGLSKMLGLDARPATAKLLDRFGLSKSVRGVVVVSVTPGSDAADKGLFPGLMIDEVNQTKIASLDDLARLVGAAREAGRPAVLLKVTDAAGDSRFVAVRLN